MDSYLLDNYALNKGLVENENIPFDELFISDFNIEIEKQKELLEKIKTNNLE